MIIVPALLEKEPSRVIETANKLRGVAQWIQIDFMDQSMTDDSTCDLHDLVGELDGFDIEVHLMTAEPEKYFDACEALGAKRVYFHLGEVESPTAVLSAMDPYNFTKGIALSPQTSIEDAFTYIDEVDAVQVMTITPGKQGNPYMPEMLEKVTFLRERRTDLWISVDGGANEKTVPEMKIKSTDAAGVGSALSQTDDIVEKFHALQELAKV